jgi:DNA-binding MltR family transcriptional regulator
MQSKKPTDDSTNALLELRDLIEKEVDNQKSDRSLVLISAILLEMKVTELLSMFLVEDESSREDSLLDRNHPIETFGAKTNLAYRLGIISSDMKKDLDWVRDLRNDVAHKKTKNKLNPDIVRNIAEKFISSLPKYRQQFFEAGSRGDFLLSVEFLLLALEEKKKGLEGIGRKRTAREKIYQAYFLCSLEEGLLE